MGALRKRCLLAYVRSHWASDHLEDLFYWAQVPSLVFAYCCNKVYRDHGQVVAFLGLLLLPGLHERREAAMYVRT